MQIKYSVDGAGGIDGLSHSLVACSSAVLKSIFNHRVPVSSPLMSDHATSLVRTVGGIRLNYDIRSALFMELPRLFNAESISRYSRATTAPVFHLDNGAILVRYLRSCSSRCFRASGYEDDNQSGHVVGHRLTCVISCPFHNGIFLTVILGRMSRECQYLVCAPHIAKNTYDATPPSHQVHVIPN